MDADSALQSDGEYSGKYLNIKRSAISKKTSAGLAWNHKITISDGGMGFDEMRMDGIRVGY